MTDQQATAPAYQSPIPADHPSRKFFVSGRFDTDPATMTNRTLVQSFGDVRWESGLGASELDDDAYDALAERSRHLQTEIIRRLGGIA